MSFNLDFHSTNRKILDEIYLKKHRERFVYVQIGTKTNSFSMFFILLLSVSFFEKKELITLKRIDSLIGIEQ